MQSTKNPTDSSQKNDKKEPFKLNWLHWTLIGVMIILLIIGGINYYKTKEKIKTERAWIAQELTARNITLYTLSNCPACKEQKKFFKEEIRYLRVITCDIAPDDFCTQLKAVPAWKLPDDKVILGVLEYKNFLQLISACTLNSCNLLGNFTKIEV